MDSLTQIVLGASVGEAILGKKIGNRAILWGAIGGTIPDLDVALNFFLSDVQGTLAHRTFSHSLIVLTLLAPLLGYTVHRLYQNKTPATPRDWTWLFLGALLTHPLLDAFTNYGTMLFYPVSDVRIAWRTIAIIDPVYTLPLLVGTVAVLFYNWQSPQRQRINRITLAISSTYLLLTCLVKFHVHQTVQEQVAMQNIAAQDFLTTPAFFNTLLWSVVVDDGAEYQVGYYSLLDAEGAAIDFKSIPKNENLLAPYLQGDSPAEESLRDLIRFTEHFYAVAPAEEGVVLNDLRFGPFAGWFDPSRNFIFSFRIYKEAGQVQIEQQEQSFSPTGEELKRFWQRTLGD